MYSIVNSEMRILFHGYSQERPRYIFPLREAMGVVIAIEGVTRISRWIQWFGDNYAYIQLESLSRLVISRRGPTRVKRRQ
jgi:hypothetical protein